MATKKSKPRGAKLGASVRNLTASFPWLKNKTFLIPAVAFVLVLSTVGVVSAVQGGVFSSSGQGTADTSLEDTDAEAAEQPAIGFACVAGTEICEEVKSILLNTDYDEVVTNWTRESLIAHLESKYGRSRIFATDVVDAVRFDWGDGSSYAGADAGSPGSGSSSGSTNAATTCRGGVDLCNAVKEIFTLGHFDLWVRVDLVNYLMGTYGASRATVEAAIDSTGYKWADSVTARESVVAPTAPTAPNAVPATPAPPAASVSTAAETARLYMDSWSSSSYAISRQVAIDNLENFYQLSTQDATTALDSLNVNWNLNAAKAARYFEAQSFTDDMSRIGWISLLSEDVLFTQSEAAYAVDSLGINWEVNASKAALWLLEYFPCDFFVEDSEFGPSALVSDLAGYIMGTFDFTEDEAFAGAFDQLESEGEWTWKIYPNCSP